MNETDKNILILFVIAIIDSMFVHSNALFMSILRRTMYIPVWMGALYYDYFTTHAPMLFSDSAIILQAIIPAQHESGALDLISKAYFNGVVPSPNTGMFAESIMQLGYIGIVVYPLIVSAIVQWCGSSYEELGKEVALVVAAKAAIQMINVPILRTDFVLSFVLLAIVIWAIMKKQRSKAIANRGVRANVQW